MHLAKERCLYQGCSFLDGFKNSDFDVCFGDEGSEGQALQDVIDIQGFRRSGGLIERPAPIIVTCLGGGEENAMVEQVAPGYVLQFNGTGDMLLRIRKSINK